MAKFKVGDKVKVVGQYRATGHNTGNVATVTDVGDSHGMPLYELTYQDGMKLAKLTDRELIAANSAPRSANPVVQNALAATARNAAYDNGVASKAFKDALAKMNSALDAKKSAVAKLEELELAASEAVSLAESAKREESLSKSPNATVISGAAGVISRAKKLLKAAQDADQGISAVN